MDMKKAALALAGLAVGFVAGYGTGRVSTGTPINPLSLGKGSYEEGYAAAQKKLADSGLLPPALTETRVLTGRVKDISGNTLTFEADLTTSNPLETINAPKERNVTIASGTKVYRLVPKTQAEIDEETSRPRADESGRPLPPPSLMQQQTIALADIKVGELITVTAGADILRATSFEATEVAVAFPEPTSAFTPPTAPPTNP
jgi:hypothetical protein